MDEYNYGSWFVAESFVVRADLGKHLRVVVGRGRRCLLLETRVEWKETGDTLTTHGTFHAGVEDVGS